jgi:hypothetical protein
METQTNYSRFMASAEGDLTPEATRALRASGDQMNACIASLVDQLSEPLKGKFLEIKANFNTMLAGLPPTDAVPAAQEGNGILRQVLWTMRNMQDLISQLTATASAQKTEYSTLKASMTGEVEKAIEARIKDGSLLTKEGATQLATDASATAVSAARTKWEADLKAINTRKLSLASASIPVPANESILAVEDAAYATAQEKAKTRAEKLKPFNLSLNRVAELSWNASDAQFDDTLAMLTEVGTKQPASKPGGANPFVNAPASPAGEKPLKQRVGMI